ncbi:MAG TPA: hypothetical protein VFZ81_15710 [Burkholderiales bacterium]
MNATRKRARASVTKKKPTDEQILEAMRQGHEGGDAFSALDALRFCALSGIAMPLWLAKIVSRAIGTAETGKPDSLLGLGNERRRARWRKRFLRGRDEAMRWTFQHIDELLAIEGLGRKVARGELKASLAKTHRLSAKAVDKIVYRKSPTLTSKK